MNKFVKTLIEGALGIGALAAVAGIAYGIGHKMGELETSYEKLSNDEPEPEKAEKADTEKESEEPEVKTNSKSGGLVKRAGGFFGKKLGTIRRILSNPERQKVEMFVDGDIFRINILPRAA